MNVRWSEHAAVEFADTAAYVAREFGSQAAVKMRDDINEAVVRISQFPNIGKLSFTDEKTGVEFRELACRLNSVVYSVYKEEIYIVSIWSNRQNRANLYSTLRADAKGM
jgi:plasmid stabilization system protein ParE